MGHGKINSIPCRNTASNFFKAYPPTITWKNGSAINNGESSSWTTSCQKGETTNTFWICSLSIPTVSTSPCSTCFKTCFQKENMPRPFLETPNTSWSSKIPHTMSPCAPYWRRCIPTKDGVPSWRHIINAPRYFLVIWPLMYILRVAIIRDPWVTCCDAKVAFTVTDRTIMDDDSPIRISNYGFDHYFMQGNDLQDDDANRFSPNNAW